jgi:hypothetical protein
MNTGEQPFGEERRDASRVLEQHVAQVWATSIADHDGEGLFRLGTACLEVADATPDAGRRTLLSSVAYTLLLQAGSEDAVVGTRIVAICAREPGVGERGRETSQVIADLGRKFGEDGRPLDDDVA